MKYIKFILYVLISFVFVGCGSNKPVDKYFFQMGTIIHITIEEKKEKDFYKVIIFMNELTEKINNDQIKIAESNIGEEVAVSKEFLELYDYADHYYNISNGLYDPTSITVARLYGFPDKVLSMPSFSELKVAKANAGFKKLEVKNGKVKKLANTYIDYSANSKGYIIDKTVKYMKKEGFENFIVNAGGDLYANGLKYGKSQYKVSIEDPDREHGIADIIKLTNKAVATSGNYERFFITPDNKRITHIFSGVNFEPNNNYKSVSVIADTAQQADGYATLYFISDIGTIMKYCEKYTTPVFIITLDNAKIKLCGWEKYEE